MPGQPLIEGRALHAETTQTVILGAGAIGCYIGGHWQQAGLAVTLLGRKSTVDAISASGLQLSGSDDIHLAAGQIGVSDDPAVLAGATLIVLAIKSTGLAAAIAQIRQHAQPGTPILCLLNGVSPAQTLAAALPDHPVSAGMVPFNVVWTPPARFHRSAIGTITVARNAATEALAAQVAGSGAAITPSDDIEAVLYGKLLLNLNNPINALSGLSLYDQLRQRPYRRVFSAALREALTVLQAAGIRPAKVGAASPAIGAALLNSTDFLFNTLIMRLQRIEPASTTSMAIDLAAGRTTEIDTLNGDILRLAAGHGLTAPVNQTLVDLIKAAEAGGRTRFSGAELMRAVCQR